MPSRRVLLFLVCLGLLPYHAEAGEPASSGDVVIVPHRAIYKMSLAGLRNGANVTNVSGKMLFEWRDTCDGWAVQQNLRLAFAYTEGEEAEVNSTVVSWESKDGKRYRFNVRRLTNGKETEVWRGRATLKENGGQVVYDVPQGKNMELPADALFPSAHTLLILKEAEEKEPFFSRLVFDGSDEEGRATISAFVTEAAEEDPGSPTLKDNPLLKKKAWPVRLAFFKPSSQTGEPDYEMNLALQGNGVARSMRIDYGDFSVQGALIELEALPAASCKK